MRSILLTGGAGFIGSSLARHMLAQSEVERLVVLDRLTGEGGRGNLIGPDRDPRFVFVEGDVANQRLVMHLLKMHGITGIFNLAADRATWESGAEERDFIATNVAGTNAILEAARHASVPLLQCSVDGVYGSVSAPDRFAEESPLSPGSLYAASKASADLLCLAAAASFKQEVVITRSSRNYGPRQGATEFIPLLVSRAVHDQRFDLAGRGSHIRDWIHVDDHCRGMIMAFTRGPSGHVFNFGGNCERTNLGIVRSILAQLGKPEALLDGLTGHLTEPRRSAVDSGKALRYFGWVPRSQLQSELPSVVRELSANLTASQSAPPTDRWAPSRSPRDTSQPT